MPSEALPDKGEQFTVRFTKPARRFCRERGITAKLVSDETRMVSGASFAVTAGITA